LDRMTGILAIRRVAAKSSKAPPAVALAAAITSPAAPCVMPRPVRTAPNIFNNSECFGYLIAHRSSTGNPPHEEMVEHSTGDLAGQPYPNLIRYATGAVRDSSPFRYAVERFIEAIKIRAGALESVPSPREGGAKK
jgi:hypothetical protein